MSPTSRQLSAIHEAAHAVGAESYGWPVKKVGLRDAKEIVDGFPSTTTGFTEALRPPASIENIGLLVAVALCGYGAARRVMTEETAEECAKESGLDWQKIGRLFKEAKIEEPGLQLAAFYEAIAETENILTEYAKAIDKIADVLVAKSYISGDDVRRIIAEEKAREGAQD